MSASRPTPLTQPAGWTLHAARVIPRVTRHVHPQSSNKHFDGQLADEQVIWLKRRSSLYLLSTGWPLIAGAVLLLAISLALGGASLLVPVIQLVGWLGLIGYAIWFGSTSLWRWLHAYYILTNQRVISSVGYLHSHRAEIPLKSIGQVRVEQRAFYRVLLGIGDVEVRPVGNAILLAGVAHPRDIADSILDAMEGSPRATVPHTGPNTAPLPRVSIPQVQPVLDRLAEPATLPPETPVRQSPIDRLVHRKIPIRFLSGESLVAVVYRHWCVLLRNELSAIGLIAGGLLVWGLLPLGQAAPGVRWLALAAGVVGGAVMAYFIFLNWADDVFILTTHRVIDIDRLFFVLAEYSNDAPYARVQNIRVEQTLLGKILGFGSIIVETSGRKFPITMRDIPNAFTVMDRIFAQMRLGQTRESLNALNKQKKENYLWFSTMLNELLIQVPELQGLTFADAIVLARRAGLRLIVEERQSLPEVLPNQVLYQSPQAGSSVFAHSDVRVILSA
jgi:membrane protein YdbS with pleckstrin-like domain